MCYRKPMSPAQLSAFSWWLDQPRENQTALTLSIQAGIAPDTAEKWITAFRRRLSNALEKQVAGKLKQHVEEYERVQTATVESAATVADLLQERVNEIRKTADLGGVIPVKELVVIASGLKSVYQVAEQASGADVVKKKDVQAFARAASKGGEVRRLPDLGELAARARQARGEVIPSGGGPIMETGIENLPGDPESPAE